MNFLKKRQIYAIITYQARGLLYRDGNETKAGRENFAALTTWLASRDSACRARQCHPLVCYTHAAACRVVDALWTTRVQKETGDGEPGKAGERRRYHRCSIFANHDRTLAVHRSEPAAQSL